MGPRVQKCHKKHKHGRTFSRKSENVKCLKTDSQELIPEWFVGVQGTPGNPWEPLKPTETPENPENPENPQNPEIPRISPIGPLGPWALSDAVRRCPTLWVCALQNSSNHSNLPSSHHAADAADTGAKE